MIWPKTLKRNQLTRAQCLHIRAVQLRRVRAVVYQYQGGAFMMTQHSRLLSYWSNSAMGLHYRPWQLVWFIQTATLGCQVWPGSTCLRSEKTS